MSSQQGRVIALEGETMVVELPPRSGGCGRCDQPGGCKSGMLVESGAPQRIVLPRDMGLKIGDPVALAVADGAVLRAAMSAYGLPLLLAFSGAAAGQWMFGSDAASACGVLLGLVGGVIALRRAGVKAEVGACQFSLQKSD